MSDITLEVNPTVTDEDLAPIVETPVAKPVADATYLENSNLTPEEEAQVNAFVEKIDLTDSNLILTYGASAQKKFADFSNQSLESVKSKDMGEVGNMITDLVVQLKGFDANEEKKGIAGWFKKRQSALERFKAQYDSAADNVDKICGALQTHQNTLTKDAVQLDKMYEDNLTYFKELTMYIMAGKKRLAIEKEGKLVELQNRAAETGLAEDAQAARDYGDLLNRFEKKLTDLELTRTVAIQMAPQIRMIQSNDTLMVDRIQSTLMNTIPLWKNQMTLAINMVHSQDAMSAQKAVNDMTNQLLLQNADTLKQGTVEIAKESERSLIDIETVRTTNGKLIETLDEVLRIQEEGRVKRAQTEQELANIEAELKTKLLTLSKTENAGGGVKIEDVEVVSEQ